MQVYISTTVLANDIQILRFITLRAKLRGAVYCNRSCLFVCVFVCMFVCGFVCLWVCYHEYSKLRASIFTKLGLWVKVVTISS